MKPLRLLALALAAGLTATSAISAAPVMLDWNMMPPWDPGDLVHTYSFPGVNVKIEVVAMGSGTGTFESWNGFPPETFPCTALMTPYRDGSPAPSTYPSNRFGTKLDLGVVFDPGASNNRSVEIRINFTDSVTGLAKAVSTLKFEISDIDWSGNGTDCVTGLAQGFRQDQVVITANSGAVNPALTAAAPATATFTISPANTATANLNQASNTDDNGTLLVNFGASMVTDVLITYNEAAYNLMTNNNPGYRGIGLLGVTMFPVELMEFSIE